MSEGNTTPRVATTPPILPSTLRPAKVAVFTAMTPGVHWPMANQSASSSSVAQPLFSTTSRCKMGSIA